MPDHLGSDQRKVKEDKGEDKPIQGDYAAFRMRVPFAQNFVRPNDLSP